MSHFYSPIWKCDWNSFKICSCYALQSGRFCFFYEQALGFRRLFELEVVPFLSQTFAEASGGADLCWGSVAFWCLAFPCWSWKTVHYFCYCNPFSCTANLSKWKAHSWRAFGLAFYSVTGGSVAVHWAFKYSSWRLLNLTFFSPS